MLLSPASDGLAGVLKVICVVACFCCFQQFRQQPLLIGVQSCWSEACVPGTYRSALLCHADMIYDFNCRIPSNVFITYYSGPRGHLFLKIHMFIMSCDTAHFASPASTVSGWQLVMCREFVFSLSSETQRFSAGFL